MAEFDAARGAAVCIWMWRFASAAMMPSKF
jgi:hypothetical protein